MKLISLSLRNFKGIKEFTLNTAAGNVVILGDNATGKTTIFDAFNWLFFDKDSQNKKDFNIKTLDEHNEPAHHINHEVEATIEHTGRIVSLKKVYAEKWTTKRGNPVAEFSGHTTDYFVDGVPKPKKEYESFIASLTDEAIFKLLMNPSYFNEQLHWQKRREILLDICGNISDAEVIDSAVSAGNKDIHSLMEVLNQGRSLDDHRKVIAARQAAINKELKEIPARIDEVQRGLPDISGIFTREVLQAEIDSLKAQQQQTQQEIVRIENGGAIAEKQKFLREVEGKIIDIQNRHRAANEDKSFAKRKQLNELTLQLSSLDSKIASNTRAIEKNNAEIKRCELSRNCLRDKWHQINGQEFVSDVKETCPTCGQHLPEDQIHDAFEKAKEQFNLSKSKQLEEVNAEGKRHKEKENELQRQIEQYSAEIAEIDTTKNSIKQSIDSIQNDLKFMKAIPDISSNPEYNAALAEKEEIEQQIDDLKSQQHAVIRGLQDQISLIGSDISSREKDIAKLDQSENGLKRIDALNNQEKQCRSEYEALQKELYLSEEFIRTKVNLLESRINSRFKMARFKLFNQQINGGLEECCETLFKGIPYSDMNNAARINVGLDIINTLSEFYGFSAPIFVDNAESVTRLTETTAQVISLVVSKPDVVLRIEHEGNQLKEAV